MSVLRPVFADQLSLSLASLADCDKVGDIILLCEVWDEATFVRHHKKKIAFLFSAMRHFAAELQALGYRVEYTTLDAPENTGSFRGEAQRYAVKHGCDRIALTLPGEYRVLEDVQTWQAEFGIPVEIRDDSRFLCTPAEFAAWAEGRKQPRMEHFYREMRKGHRVLMRGKDPVGGQWNFDADNRKPPKAELVVPKPYAAPIDAITREVLALVANRFSDHFGDLEPFHFAVTRQDALAALALFIEQRLASFGDYQDAMVQGEPWMFHAHIGLYLNCGLLLPRECIDAAEFAFDEGSAPLNAVEGFIRQILGWREFVRGIYWLKMPDYAHQNALDATRALPAFYWTGDTQMNCLRQCIGETKQNAYAHHIQRLMVLGNFALLAGLDPREVNEWFLIVYADAFEWVELPNVSGMILFADGGYLASKPYAAGGAYINKMSNYCKGCRYKVTKKNGPEACPFNYLYWNFLETKADTLSSNHRLAMSFRTLAKMDDEKRAAIRDDSARFFKALETDGMV